MCDLKKRRSFLFLIGLLLFLGFTSCKKKSTGIAPVDDPSDSLGGSDPSFTKSVLLIEFTGHKCGNCPAGGETADQLKNVYGSRIVIISAHVGTLAQPQPPASGKYTLDFRTRTGDELDQEFGASVSGIPKGVINYIEYSGTSLVLPGAWPEKVDQLLQQDSVPFGLTADMSVNGAILNLTAACEFGDSLSGNFNLGAFLTEDSIISWQKDYRLSGNQDIEFFEHKYVLRGNFYMPGNIQVLPWGLPISDTSFAEGHKEVMDLDIQLDPSWRQNHLNAVVFLYDQDTETILQVKEFHLSEEL